MPQNKHVDIKKTCEIVKTYDFTLRLSLNMSKEMLRSAGGSSYREIISNIFDKALKLGANQITFRKFYADGENEQSRWISENTLDELFFIELNKYVRLHGRLIGKLPYGYDQFSLNGISVVIDEDCMNEEKAMKEASKYFVLRPDCKLYDGWNKHDIIF